ncbi:MAG: hypothetical protein GX807_03360 [Erysipelotrichia bacterium]|nr:hypothetical protein [Erysipelotrichia bacterium]
MKKITEQHDAVLVIESLNNKKAIKDVRFSLSTKVADALSSGKLVFGVGNTDCGAINFLSRHNCAVIVTSTEQIVEVFDSIKDGIIDLSQLARNANSILKIKFDKEANYSLFEKVVKKTADNGGKQ